ncbi:hypothetical protein SAFG77S_10061 [Streptomyces afghaniensis]
MADWWALQVTGMRTLRKPSARMVLNTSLVALLPQDVSSGIASRVLPRFQLGCIAATASMAPARNLDRGGCLLCRAAGGGERGAAGQSQDDEQCHQQAGQAAGAASAVVCGLPHVPHVACLSVERKGRELVEPSRGSWSNQSKWTVPSAAYMPMTRPVKPPATSVDR